MFENNRKYGIVHWKQRFSIILEVYESLWECCSFVPGPDVLSKDPNKNTNTSLPCSSAFYF